MLPEKFRRQLQQESQQWQQEGLISAEQWQQLTARYQLNLLDMAAKNRFTSILIGVGCILIGLGLITFVAANWQEMTRELRSTLLLSVFVGVNAGGFYLWRDRRSGGRNRLGEGLLLLGGLALGANMGLMSQMFHIDGPPGELFLAWGIGVLVMAYSLRLTSLGMLAVVVLGLGYWQCTLPWMGWLGGSPRLLDSAWATVLVQQMPLLAWLLFLPLAYLCRSGVLFTFGAIASISSLQTVFLTYRLSPFPLLTALLIMLPVALLWSYDDTVWTNLLGRRWPAAGRRPSGTAIARRFQPLARSLAVCFLGYQLYWLSFRGMPSLWAQSTGALRQTDVALPWFNLIGALLLMVWTVGAWVYRVQAHRQPSGQGRLNRNTLAIGGITVMVVLMAWWAIAVPDSAWASTFGFNALLTVVAIGTIRNSLSAGKRSAFWFGMVLLVLQILSRLLEYNTELMFKAFMFVLCGVGIILAGLWFERYVRALTPDRAADRAPQNSP
jgi:uncharacterized membrane protein